MQQDEKKTTAKCDHCPVIFSLTAGGTSTLKRHLENIHHLSLKPASGPAAGSKNKEHQPTIVAAMSRYDNKCHVKYELNYVLSGKGAGHN